MVRQAHQLARFRNVPTRRKGVEPMLHGRVILVGQEFVEACQQEASHDGRNGEPVLRIIDGGLKKLGKGQLAKALVQLGPGAGGAGDGHGDPAEEGNFIGTARCPSRFRCKVGGGVAAAVQAIELILDPYQSEAVAAEARIGGLHNGLANRCSDGGIDGVAALLQHREACLGR